MKSMMEFDVYGVLPKGHYILLVIAFTVHKLLITLLIRRKYSRRGRALHFPHCFQLICDGCETYMDCELWYLPKVTFAVVDLNSPFIGMVEGHMLNWLICCMSE